MDANEISIQTDASQVLAQVAEPVRGIAKAANLRFWAGYAGGVTVSVAALAAWFL